MIKKFGVSYCPTKEGLVRLLAEELHHGYFVPWREELARKMIETGEIIISLLHKEGFTTNTLYKNQKNNFGIMMYPDGRKVGYNLQKVPYVFDLGVRNMFELLTSSNKQKFHATFPIRLQFLPIYENLAMGQPSPYSLNYKETDFPDDFNFGGEEDIVIELSNLAEESELVFDFPIEKEELLEKANYCIPHWETMKNISTYLYELNFGKRRDLE